jgi:ElaB/YqjD/DUF883 family membrane-anchored ribosome-binding protein
MPADDTGAAATTKGNGQKLLTSDEAATLKGDIDNVRKDMKQLFEDLKRMTRNEAEFAGRKAGDLKGAAVEAAREKRDDVEEYVKEHPIGALAAAAGVGFILALLVGR